MGESKCKWEHIYEASGLTFPSVKKAKRSLTNFLNKTPGKTKSDKGRVIGVGRMEEWLHRTSGGVCSWKTSTSVERKLVNDAMTIIKYRYQDLYPKDATEQQMRQVKILLKIENEEDEM